MLAQSKAPWFRLRVNLWSWLTGRGRFEWGEFERRLEAAEFKSYADWHQAKQSLGWSGLTEEGDKWLFGVAGYRLPFLSCYGKCAMRHELFHAAQDFKTDLFGSEAGFLRSVAAEYSAHLWGGPLIGLPLAYGGTAFIVIGVTYLIYLIALLLGVL
jgi:hypothetical protein